MQNYRYTTPEHMHRSTCSAAITISDKPVAMAYVPWQEWHSLYNVEKGLHCGTIFEELHKPFRGAGGCHNG